MTFQWRRFQFFDRELLSEEDEKTPLALFQDFTPTCSTSGRGQLIFGDAKGVIRVINRDFEKQEFQGFDGERGVIALHQLKRSNMLIGIGMEQDTTSVAGAGTTIKIWNLDNRTGEAPTCARAIRIFSAKFPPVPVTSFSVLEDLTQLAIGLGNGAVMLFDGNILRERNCKQKLLHREGPCITGVHFREDPNGVSLYVVSTEEVMSFFTKARGQQRVVIDKEGGSELKCSITTEDRKLVVARDKAVYFYDAEEKGICFGFEGMKKQISWYNHYLILVNETKDAARNSLSVYDLRNKFIAFQHKFDPIVNIVMEWGSIFVYTISGKMYQLSEKDLPTKMEMLFKKNLYNIAISLANSQDCDKSYVMDIFQKYGDHLYSKGDYEGAIQQYLETIGFVEPSYVIRKFLDAQRIHNLTHYLQALHEKGGANTDHTTLLLNCYTKLKDVKRLDEFVKSESGFNYDVEVAIRVCRQAGYVEHALYLARRHNQHDLCLKILLDDAGNHRDALAYIRSLEFLQAEKFTKLYGQKLLWELADDVTALLKELCTNYIPRPLPKMEMRRSGDDQKGPVSLGLSSTALPPSTDPNANLDAVYLKGKAEDFIHFFVGKSRQLQEFLEHVQQDPKCSPIIFNTLLELYLRLDTESGASTAETKEGKKPGLSLSGAAAAGTSSAASSAASSSSLSSASSSSSSSSSSSATHPLSLKIMGLLKSAHEKYDVEHALVLVKLYNFEKGILYLYEKLKLYHEILQHHMEHNQFKKILKTCKKYGDHDRNLWVLALSYFAAKDEDSFEHEIIDILDNIERNNLLAPLMVIQILSQNPNKPLSVVKDYIIRTLQQEQAVIVADEREIRRYQSDTQAMREEIQQLTTSATTFQGMRCHHCMGPLQVPAVHFLCMHSFHQRCMGDSDRECPKCSQEYKKVREIQTSMKQSALQHDKFFKALDQDGFATVAEYFGRGIFDKGTKKSDPSV